MDQKQREEIEQVKYAMFLAVTDKPWCWLCGARPREQPRWWHAPWLIERAHIVAAPRRQDRRAVILLCSLCHRLEHGQEIDGRVLQLTLAHKLWLKLHRDPSNYDRKFLRANSHTNLPRAERHKFDDLHAMYFDRHRS